MYTLGLTVVPLDPAIVALTGESDAIVTFSNVVYLPVGEVRLTRRFKSASLTFDYSNGVTPGNGLYLTSRQTSGAVAYSYLVARSLVVRAQAGYSQLSALGQALGKYANLQGGIQVFYKLTGATSLDVRYDYRHYTYRRCILGDGFQPREPGRRIWLGGNVIGDVVSNNLASNGVLNGSAIKILLVEDEPPLLQLIEKYLQRLGFEVETHLRSFDALRNFEAGPRSLRHGDRRSWHAGYAGRHAAHPHARNPAGPARPGLQRFAVLYRESSRFIAAASGVPAEALRAQNAGRSSAEFAPGTAGCYSATAVSA